MIRIEKNVIKHQANFWNHCVFHPTDAIEDPWGRRILDRLSSDKAIGTVRIYSMFEDIVYQDGDGRLTYDFRLSDLRLDYLVDRGFDILIAYAGIPDFLSESNAVKTTVAKNKTRYKGKMWNTAPPKDYALWEEICYEYTKHIVERYGIETVSKWRIHCFNEPDIPAFFRGDLGEEERDLNIRCKEYCMLYNGFERAVRRVSDRIRIGGPALAFQKSFLDGFLKYVREKNLKLDYIAFHNYGTSPQKLNGGGKLEVESIIDTHGKYLDIIKANGFEDKEIIADEWGAASAGFYNVEECPTFIFREHEVYSAYYVKLIRKMIDFDPGLSRLMICLSGQHEMLTDFSGFRNFFTLNFIAKPIYNAFILASKLGPGLLSVSCKNENVSVIPTKTENGDYAVLLSYSSRYFEEDIPDITETVEFEEGVSDRTVTVWRIDKSTTNPYRLYQKMGIDKPTPEELRLLREEGRLKPTAVQSGAEPLTLKLTPNCTYLITVTK